MANPQHVEVDSNARAGILLIVATAAALIASNTGLADEYSRLLTTRLEFRLDHWSLGKPLLLWINDGLMAIFFLFVGLEIKREWLHGSLSSPRLAALPLLAALGGMAVPALIYLAMNHADTIAARGWAIPTATDIAFALGILALLGSRVPATLKILLTAIAVIDDLGAIVIIALFYTDDLSTPMLAAAAIGLAVLFALNALKVRNIGVYLLVGLCIWVAVLKSGVHATLAGVAVALFIPADARAGEHETPLATLEHALQPWVMYAIVPVFAFANAGVALIGTSWDGFPAGVSIAIAAGLVAGKTIGVFGFSWLAVTLRMAELPDGINWRIVLGMAMLCGIGFTMSLFIGTLAFENLGAADGTTEGAAYGAAVRVGVLGGSIIAALAGIVLLRWGLRANVAARGSH
jgi:Na+:H+ antiporter, NhaA family